MRSRVRQAFELPPLLPLLSLLSLPPLLLPSKT
ncbi:hypothetical protein FrEUN1fDRAFT_3023 [Parafrankia sp. EUN1f]|nr:hypothetical protein FrEUN1fDRAFT_3023 [Parafrankia sp. EUN1f]